MHDFLKLVKNTFLLVVLTAFVFSPVFYFNFYIDPYGIFRNNFSAQRIEPNSHFIKIRHLLKNMDKYDSFILGNSRANNIDIAQLPNGKWYNLYYSLGLPKEHLEDLKILKEHNVNIKNILLCIDMSSYLINYQNRDNDALRKPYPNNIFGVCKYYIEYSFQVPQMDFVKEVLKTKQNDIYREILKEGVARDTESEKFILENTQAHKSDAKFSTPVILGYENNSEALLSDIKKLIAFCKDNSIQIKIIVNPVYRSCFLVNNVELYFDFLKRLSGITDFYDFSGINKITCNSYFFYEPSHFRPLVGNAMVDFVYKNKKIDSIPDFGIYIDKKNIDVHLEKMKYAVSDTSKTSVH